MDTIKTQETPLEEWVLKLGGHDWRVIGAAVDALHAAGEAGRAAVMAGLSHPNPRIRRECADFFDHHGTDTCVTALTSVALNDETPAVRRNAIHSLSCQRCKDTPLQFDGAALLLKAALTDPSAKVRYHALWGLTQQPKDERIPPVLRKILAEETHRKVLDAAHGALQWHDEAYRQEVIAKAKARCRAEYEGRQASTPIEACQAV